MDWSDEFAVGNDLVNTQHKTLIGIFNALHDAVTHGDDSGILAGSLAELIDFSQFHFRAEEEMLARSGSAHLDAQKQDHDRMARQILELNEKYKQGSATMIFEILDLLHNWLTNHVKVVDRRSFPV
jgi:hemerythrin